MNLDNDIYNLMELVSEAWILLDVADNAEDLETIKYLSKRAYNLIKYDNIPDSIIQIWKEKIHATTI